MTTRLAVVGCVLAGLQATTMAQQFGWTQVSSTGPAPRRLHGMAYDSARARTVLFGGDVYVGFGSQSSGDTWEWSGTAWTQTATGGPPPRNNHAMAYDSLRGKTVMFGGTAYSTYTSWMNDTWEWDGATWTQRIVNGPAARASHAMAFDAQRGRTLLFGGWDGTSTFGDTWEWSGNAWTQASATGPSSRSRHALAYDGLRGRSVMFGGYNGSNSYLGDTWEWDGATWTQRGVSGPPARATHAMTFDTRRGVCVMFGGQAWITGYLGDTWEFDGVSWTQVANTGPEVRCTHAMAFDNHRGVSVMFGGFDETIPNSLDWLGDTWEWGGALSGTSTAYGSGCGSPALQLSPIPGARPTINNTAQASLTNIPSSIAFVSLGWSRTMAGPFPLPFSMLWYGMPGCYMLQSTEAAAQPVAFVGPSTATYGLPLPNWSGLVGLHLYLQGWAAAPGANPGGVIVSNGVEWVIGNL